MAYFHCLIGGGSSGGGYELTVTCDSAFSGTTITCTDGTTTLTETCPSSSPHEVVFEIPNGGDWTISGTTGGHTVSTGVSIPTSAELIATIQQTVTIYSAKEDTISYVDIDGATQTITFASGETSKQVTIEIEPSGSSITFTSGVAKDPSDLSNYYSKTVTIDSNTTDVYLMPDNTLYWYGYLSDNIEDITTANGWATESGWTLNGATSWNTNSITETSGTRTHSGIGNKTTISGNTIYGLLKGDTYASDSYGILDVYSSKNVSTWSSSLTKVTSTSVALYSMNLGSDKYIQAEAENGRGMTVYALWYE